MCLFFYRYWLELRGFSPADVIWLNHIGDEIFTKRHKISHLFRCQRLLTIILNCLECIATRARAIPYIGHEILVLERLVSIFRDQEQLCTLIITIVNDGDILGIPSMSKNISCNQFNKILIVTEVQRSIFFQLIAKRLLVFVPAVKTVFNHNVLLSIMQLSATT